MWLPKEFTTVTPFSKYLAMAFFIIFPFFGFYLGTLYQKSLGSYVSRQGIDCSFALCPQGNKVSQSSMQYAITPTIIPSSQNGWSTYEDNNNLYSFNFPSTWKVDIQGNSYEPTKPWIRLYYIEKAQQYTFEIGQGGRGVANTDTITESQITIADQSFDQKIFYHQGNPFLISVVPNNQQTELKYFNHISIELPPTNTNQYIAQFNQILSTFTFLSNIQLK